MSIRKAIGAVKDRTSIRLAKASGNMSPDLKVAIVKATSHHEVPADDKHIMEVVNLVSSSSSNADGYVHACEAAAALSKRLSRTRDWVVAVKSLLLVNRLLDDADPLFPHEIMHANKKGVRALDMSDFRDEAHANSADHSMFVRSYALYLDQKLELMMFDRSSGCDMSREARWRSPFASARGHVHEYAYAGNGNEPVMRRSRSFGDVNERAGMEERRAVTRTPLREMKPERIFAKMGILQRLLNRVLACRPTGMAKNSRLVLIAMYPIVRESFQLYADICEVLEILQDKFYDMEYSAGIKAFHAYASAAKQIDELILFYSWCNDVGVSRTSEIPNVQRITDKLLEKSRDFLRDRAKGQKSPQMTEAPPAPQQEEPGAETKTEPDMNEITMLPSTEVNAPPTSSDPQPEPKPLKPLLTDDLVNLMDDGVTADNQGNKSELALIAGSPAYVNGQWQAFPYDWQSDVTSAWQSPAAETGEADWEVALVESASNLSRQKNAMGGGLDTSVSNGMYDQGMVRQHTSTPALTGVSANSATLPGKSSTPVVALPSLDGSVQTANQDPFAASLAIPPPYVQMSVMEKNQHWLTHEQQLWQQYASQRMDNQGVWEKGVAKRFTARNLHK